MNSLDGEEEYRRGVEQQRRAARSYNLAQVRGAAFMAGGLLSIPALVALGIDGGWLAVLVAFSCALIALAAFEAVRRPAVRARARRSTEQSA